MLLSFRDKESTLEISHYEYVLAGALLADLLLDQTILVEDTKKNHVILETEGFVGDTVLDECIEMIRQSKKPQSLKNWVSLFAHIKHLKEKVATQLVEQGILEADKSKFLKLIPMKVYPEVDPEPEREIIERLHTAIFTEVEGETYSCGVFIVPVDYANPDGDTLNMTYVVLHAENEAPTEAPIIYLSGGPGQSGIVSAGSRLYGDLRQDRDLIFPAQRGTLFSERLALEECVNLLGEQIGESELNAFVDTVSAQAQPDPSLSYDDYLVQYSETAGAINGRCHEAFTNAGVAPAQFTTANSAQDIVDLVAALGYDEFNLHGASYGTRLALEMIRRHPEANIRSVVLDSPSTPSTDRLTGLSSATHDMVVQLFANCEADAACNEAYPNLSERTAVLLEHLTNEPITNVD